MCLCILYDDGAFTGNWWELCLGGEAVLGKNSPKTSVGGPAVWLQGVKTAQTGSVLVGGNKGLFLSAFVLLYCIAKKN